MALTSDNRFAPPSATVADVAPETSGLELATRMRRLGAALLDSILNGVLFSLIQVVLGRPILYTQANVSFGFMATNMLIGLAISLLVNGWLLLSRGQTLGKIALGIRIVRSDGSRVAAGRMIARFVVQYWVALVPIFGGIVALVDVLMIFRKSRRCLHDEIADTVVIRV